MLSLSDLPARNRGTYLEKCNKVKLTTNLFKVEYRPDTSVFIYSVKVTPAIASDNGKKLRAILLANRTNIEKHVGTFVASGRTLFSVKSNGKKEETTLKIDFETVNYQLTLKRVKTFNMKDINSNLKT